MNKNILLIDTGVFKYLCDNSPVILRGMKIDCKAGCAYSEPLDNIEIL